MTAEGAAELIQHGDVLGMGGFTATGVPKAVPFALAQRAEKLHAQGIPFRVGLETGASMGDSCDGALARAHAVEFRTPYQSNKSMREEINAEGTHYFDMHLSHMAQDLRYGFLPKPNWAIIELRMSAKMVRSCLLQVSESCRPSAVWRIRSSSSSMRCSLLPCGVCTISTSRLILLAAVRYRSTNPPTVAALTI